MEGYFDLMDKDEKLATVYFEHPVKIEISNEGSVLCPFIKNKVYTEEDILDYIERCMCMPKTRFNCKEVLNNLGLEEYDPWELVKITHGFRLGSERLWLRFNGEDLDYEGLRKKLKIDEMTKCKED